MGTNVNREVFIKRYKVEDLQFLKYPKGIDRFFTHRFENIQDAINGIIFYTNHEIHREDALSNAYKIESEVKIKVLKDKTLNNCIHFFRFTECLKESNIENDCNNLRDGIRVYKQLNIEKIKEIVQNRIDELIEQQKIQVFSAGLFFNRAEEAYYKRGYAYQSNVQEYNSAWWTEDLFSAIKYLRELEESDENTYYDTWVHCKIERERNSVLNTQKSNENLQLLQKAHSEYKQSIAKNKMKIEEKEI